LYLLSCFCVSTAQAADVHIQIQGNTSPTVVALYPLEQDLVLSQTAQKFSLYQKDKVFSPTLIALSQGSIVDFINDDVVYHNVFSMSETKGFDLGLYPNGDHREVMFDKAGVVRVFCAVHPDMFAQIVVVNTPWTAVVDAQGMAMVKAVPAGDYDIHLWDMKSHVLTKKRRIKVGTQTVQVHL